MPCALSTQDGEEYRSPYSHVLSHSPRTAGPGASATAQATVRGSALEDPGGSASPPPPSLLMGTSHILFLMLEDVVLCLWH